MYGKKSGGESTAQDGIPAATELQADWACERVRRERVNARVRDFMIFAWLG